MLRTAASKVARRATQNFYRGLPACSVPRVDFHASAKREEEAKPAPGKEDKGGFDPAYAIPLGIAFAVPVLNYEWYLVNEETQLAACFIAFTMIVYKQFGGVIKEALEEDGKQILAEHNKIEDEVIDILQKKIDDVRMQERVVQDAEDIKALKIQTYEKLNAAGKIKPQYEFKTQIERMLAMMETEEANMMEKAKIALMEEATASVIQEFSSSKNLKKQALQNGVAQLKGTKAGADPVKAAYLSFFKSKAEAAKKIDAAAETREARAAMVAKMNAIAKNEGFYFEFDAGGKPKMVV